MFVITQTNTVLNLNNMTCLDVIKYLNCDKADIKTKIDNYEFTIYTGTIEDTESAYHNIIEGLIHNATLIDFSEHRGTGI